ncbi:MAG: hypothetical protein CBC12_01375 [Candidatus Puniceispirillum sp. TMED52]|nr:hypothetical protein [SAR116 cluster bacterium]OUU54446.1 MAG: hypothetical protein CBC12_01375 [Candidatus Puniceispirillum sp. TMED52]
MIILTGLLSGKASSMEPDIGPDSEPDVEPDVELAPMSLYGVLIVSLSIFVLFLFGVAKM